MTEQNRTADQLATAAQSALNETAAALSQTLAELAAQLRPFPAFMGMASVQAVEIEPTLTPTRDLGCLVVTPEGRICQLDLRAIAGVAGFTETEQVEEFVEPELSAAEYIVYAATAIELLAAELRRRGQ